MQFSVSYRLVSQEAFLTTVSEKLMESAKLALSSAVGGLLGYAGKAHETFAHAFEDFGSDIGYPEAPAPVLRPNVWFSK